jgi:hypothetical protein
VALATVIDPEPFGPIGTADSGALMGISQSS